MGRWSRQVARRFLDLIDPAGAQRWLDVGCGVGSLTDEILQRYAPAAIVGLDRSSQFVTTAAANIRAAAATFVVGSADALPVRDGSCDTVVSGLVLNFVPDPGRGLAEMVRVTRPGGTVAAYVWQYDHPDFFLNRFWRGVEATSEGEGEVVPDERGLWAICTEDGLREVATTVGLRAFDIVPIEIATTFTDSQELWDSFLLGVGPAGRRTLEMAPPQRERLRTWLDERWPRAADGSIPLTARALSVSARVP